LSAEAHREVRDELRIVVREGRVKTEVKNKATQLYIQG
jgi:hypothetical protein